MSPLKWNIVFYFICCPFHQIISLFQLHPNSGSFVRPSKVNCGITFEEGVRSRYQDDTTIEKEVTEHFQRTIKARFVEVVGMEKIGNKQSVLEQLRTVVLSNFPVNGPGSSDLTTLFPQIRDLDLSGSLLSNWQDVADITRQLPSLHSLNLSGNALSLPICPEALTPNLCHVRHLVLNRMNGYSWKELLFCFRMFPHINNLQVAFNEMKHLGPISSGLLESLKEVDVGMNPISDWSQICFLGKLPLLESINANNCRIESIFFNEVGPGEKTDLFPSLRQLMLAGNPLVDSAESVAELNKIKHLQVLVMNFDDRVGTFFQEFTFARISSLQVLNRTKLTTKEKRDCELFYLKSFSNEYYNLGGTENPDDAKLDQNFLKLHPTFLQLIRVHGAPVNETRFKSVINQKLKDIKVELAVSIPNDVNHEPQILSFLPTTKVSKVKMMLKRHLKIPQSTQIILSYSPGDSSYEIGMDNDMKELEFYSVTSGDRLFVRW